MLGYHKIETKDLTPDGWLMTGTCLRVEGPCRLIDEPADHGFAWQATSASATRRVTTASWSGART